MLIRLSQNLDPSRVALQRRDILISFFDRVLENHRNSIISTSNVTNIMSGKEKETYDYRVSDLEDDSAVESAGEGLASGKKRRAEHPLPRAQVESNYTQLMGDPAEEHNVVSRGSSNFQQLGNPTNVLDNPAVGDPPHMIGRPTVPLSSSVRVPNLSNRFINMQTPAANQNTATTHQPFVQPPNLGATSMPAPNGPTPTPVYQFPVHNLTAGLPSMPPPPNAPTPVLRTTSVPNYFSNPPQPILRNAQGPTVIQQVYREPTMTKNMTNITFGKKGQKNIRQFLEQWNLIAEQKGVSGGTEHYLCSSRIDSETRSPNWTRTRMAAGRSSSLIF